MKTLLHIIVFKIHLYFEIYIARLCRHFHASAGHLQTMQTTLASRGKHPTKRRRGYPLSAWEEICRLEIFWIPEKRRLNRHIYLYTRHMYTMPVRVEILWKHDQLGRVPKEETPCPMLMLAPTLLCQGPACQLWPVSFRKNWTTTLKERWVSQKCHFIYHLQTHEALQYCQEQWLLWTTAYSGAEYSILSRQRLVKLAYRGCTIKLKMKLNSVLLATDRVAITSNHAVKHHVQLKLM